MIILRGFRKALVKIQDQFLIKTLNKLGIAGNIPKLIKEIDE